MRMARVYLLYVYADSSDLHVVTAAFPTRRVSKLLAVADGTNALADATVMRRALSYSSGLSLMIAQHPEEPGLADSGVMNEGEIASRLGLPGITPASEAVMVERDLRLVAITDGRYHPAQASTAAARAAIRQAKAHDLYHHSTLYGQGGD